MKVLAILCALASVPALGAGMVKSFAPENDLEKFDDLEEHNISQAEFEAVIARAEAFYKPLIRSVHGANLSVIHDWTNPTVNAYAMRSGNNWIVHMFGGLARRPEITVDGFEMVLCHELGHHLSGFPFSQTWAANEGGSDYFATLSCARQLWKDEADLNFMASLEVPAYPKRLCDASWSEQADRNLCYRSVQAGKSLADFLSQGSARYETPDQSVVTKTNNAHPAGQCRLDTYLAGAICKTQFDSKVIPRDERRSSRVSCLESRQEAGFRPKCWFKATL